MNRIFVVLIVSCVMLFLQGCATLVTGPNKVVNISSSDNTNVQAEVNTSTGTSNVTLPISLSVKTSRKPIEVIIKEKGYKETRFIKESKLNIWFLGDFFMSVFGLTGTTIDVSSGSIWTYDDSIVVPVIKE